MDICQLLIATVSNKEFVQPQVLSRVIQSRFSGQVDVKRRSLAFGEELLYRADLTMIRVALQEVLPVHGLGYAEIEPRSVHWRVIHCESQTRCRYVPREIVVEVQ